MFGVDFAPGNNNLDVASIKFSIIIVLSSSSFNSINSGECRRSTNDDNEQRKKWDNAIGPFMHDIVKRTCDLH